MKKSIFLPLIQFALFLAMIQPQVWAGDIKVGNNPNTDFQLTENTYSALQVSSTLSDIQFYEVKTSVGYFTMLSVPGYGHSKLEGNPMLPVIKKLIEIPYGANCEVELISEEFVEVDLSSYGISNFIIPAQPPLSKSIDNPEDIEFIFNQAAYLMNDFTGQELVRVAELGIMRGVRMARLEIAPVTYNPVKNKLKVYTNLEVKVNFVNGNIPLTLQEKQAKFSPFFAAAHKQLINYKPLSSKEFILDEPITYIIVSSPDFQAALQPFIQWKTKKGFHVVEAYTNDPQVGTTTASIKNYLQNFYNNPPDACNPQSFVLFVGDVAQIPTFNGTTGAHASDLYYCTYNGTGDIYPECYYGRFSATNLTQLQPQIDKTLEYEQYLFPDPSFLDEVMLVVGDDEWHEDTWGNGQINYGTTYYFNAGHGLYSHTYLQDPPTGNPAIHDSIIANINSGITYGNYTAHCSSSGWASPSFVIGDITSLTNAHKYPLLVGNCCESVTFNSNSFGEEILRAANKGALGYIGGSNSTYWDEDFWWGVGYESSITAYPVYNPLHLGAYDRTFHDNGEPMDEWYITQGQMPSAGNLAVTQSGSNLETYYWEIYHLMGDPSLMIYFGQPEDTPANYQGLMPLAATTFTVTTLPYAYVAISKEGVLHGCGISDASGVAIVNMLNPIVVPGEAHVVITGQNMKPYVGTVTVASPTGAYVLVGGVEIDDSNGNNNGLVDYNEYILLDVTLENLGSQMASNPVATLVTLDEYVTINTAIHNWPNIPTGGNSLETGAFSFTVDPYVPDQHTVQFELQVTDGVETWVSNINILLNSPDLVVGSYIIDDGTGNNNGRLDPGETADIYVDNINQGGADALAAIAQVFSINPLITLNNTTYELQTIAAGQSVNAIFNVTVSPSAPFGEVVNVNYILSSGPYSATTTLPLNIGLIVEDFESGGFETFEWELTGNSNWTVTNINPYEGVYSAKSGTISHNQSTILSLSLEIATDDQISFFYKVSSEGNYDYLKFYIDNVMMNQWSGEVAWSEAVYSVSAGTHTFKWEYYKDGSVNSGSDCAWLDFIVFPPVAGMSPLAVIAAAYPSTICAGESSQLSAYAMGGSGNYTYEWQPTAGLSNPNIANPVATPQASTTYYVIVDDGSAFVTDNVNITVNELPPTPTITQNGTMLVSSSINGNQWYNSDGIIPGATAQTYSPNTTDNYYVIVTNASTGCISNPSEPYYYIYTGYIEITEGQRVNIYPNPFEDHFTLDYSISSNSPVTITIYNSYGQILTTLERDHSKYAGNYRIQFDAEKFTRGVYYLKIETSEYTVIKRMVSSN